MRRGALALLVAAVGAVAGCDALVSPPTPTATSSAAAARSGITGRVIIGPTCPIEATPSDEPQPSGEEPPGIGPTLDPEATPEPPPSDDPNATADPETTPYAAGCIRPYAATVVVTSGGDGTPISRLTTGHDGRFTIDLTPGDYTLVPENGEPFPIAQPLDVTVVAGQYVEVEVNYDSGIR
jgi:hypothetical protein